MTGPAKIKSQTHRGEELLRQVRVALDSSAYPPLRSLQASDGEGAVYLRGVVPTYYLKQLAISLVSRISGIGEIFDEIRVEPPHNHLTIKGAGFGTDPLRHRHPR